MTPFKMMACGMLAVAALSPPAMARAGAQQAGGVQEPVHAAGGVFLPLVLVDDSSVTPMALVKECSHFDNKPGTYCSIIKSNLAAIPVGTKVIYLGPLIDGPILSSSIVLDTGDGSTALGYCNVSNAANTGTCSFWAGSGKLQGFQALVTLTADANGTDYHWDGGYRLTGN